MINYNLEPDERIILQEMYVKHGGMMAGFTDELYLTNYNIIIVKKGIFGRTKKEIIFSLTDIKKVDDVPQVKFGRNLDTDKLQLQITLYNSVENFEFETNDKVKIRNWINAIYKLYGIAESIPEPSESMVMTKIKSAVDSVKSILGFSTKREENTSTNVTIKCPNCCATLSGRKGQIAKCPYCGTKHTL